MPATYVVFDILALASTDVRTKPPAELSPCRARQPCGAAVVARTTRWGGMTSSRWVTGV
jgi:hypothetical protein